MKAFFSILGANGFIGSHLSAYLKSTGHDVFQSQRDSAELFSRSHCHVVYAIGLTGDFRQRPFDTVDAHVVYLMKVLREALFDSFLYLSSTRVYSGLSDGQPAHEDIDLPLRPSADSLYDLSKLLGEALCLAHPSPRVRVVRLSNVFGVGQSRHTFLAQILNRLATLDTLNITEAPESCKDYIAVEDVVKRLTDIALSGRHRLYNLASGRNLTHWALAKQLGKITAHKITFAANSPCRCFPPIDTSRLQDEFPFHPCDLEKELPRLMDAVNNQIGRNLHDQQGR